MMRFKSIKSIGFALRFALAMSCVFALGRQGLTSGAPVKDANQGMIQAVKQLEGARLFDKDVEVYSRKTADGSVTVTFRRPTSNDMVRPGRMLSKALFTVTFRKDKVSIQKYNNNKTVMLDKRLQASQQDRKRTHIVVSALSYLWKNKTSESKEVAISIYKFTYKNKETFDVTVTRIPYVPDGFTTTEVSSDFRVIGSRRGP